MKTESIFKKNKCLIFLISGLLLCFVLVAMANTYRIYEIDQYSGRTRTSYQVFCLKVYSSEKDTEFSKRVAKYVVHPPKWRIDYGYPAFRKRTVAIHYRYHGAISATQMITIICSVFDTSLDDQEVLHQFALKTLGNYEEDKFYFSRISNYSEGRGRHEIKWKEFLEEMENNQK